MARDNFRDRPRSEYVGRDSLLGMAVADSLERR